jgi:hypothetical protein
VQVVHQVLMGNPPAPHRGVESNVAAFVLRPTVVPPVGFAGGQVNLQLNPVVGKNQRVVLLLNERTAAAPVAYTFTAPPRPADATSIQVSVSGVKTGVEYFVRVQVDGAESPLNLDPASGPIGPTVTIP